MESCPDLDYHNHNDDADMTFAKMFTLADFGPIIFYPKRVATFYILGQNRVKSVSDTWIKEVNM